MPRQSPANLPAQRRRGTAAPRSRPRPGRRPANYPYQSQSPYGPPDGYGGYLDRDGEYHRSRGALHRAEAARALRRAHATARFVYRVGRGAIVHRRRLAGLYAAAGILGMGAVTAMMPSGIVLATLAGAAPALYGALKHRSARRRGEDARLTAGQAAGWAARLGVAAWLPLTAAYGFAPLLRLTLAAGCAIGLPWWAIHTRPLELEPVDEPERVGDEDLDPISAQWLATVGAPGGALVGSYLLDPRPTDNGWEAVIQLVPGRQRPETAIGATVLIAGAYGVDPTRVSVLRMPDARADRVRIALYQANPLQQVREFTGPTLDRETGWITIGTYPDGTPARWRLYEPGSGPCGGMIFGAQGSGKSALANAIAAEITHSGIGTLLLADGQEGLSMPDWSEHGALWFAFSPSEARRMLQALEQIGYSRQKRRRKLRWTDAEGNTHRGKGFFDGTPDEPYIYALIDEWSLVAKDPECRRIVALIFKAFRKVGITCILISQIPSVAEFGGDNDASVIRSLSSTTNVAMFRTAPADKSSQHMGGMGVDGVDPTAIPAAFADESATAGMGYLRAPGGTALVFRSNYVRNAIHWAHSAPEIEFEDEAVDAAGEHYQTWRARYALVLDGEDDPADLAEAQEREEEGRAGRDREVAPLPRASAAPAGAGGQVVAMPQHAQLGPRDGALRILRGTGQILSTAQITAHLNALTGAEHSRDAVQAALRRALTDGEVVQYPPLPTGKDRSARWQAASEISSEADRERDA
jgi:hypothetical protein